MKLKVNNSEITRTTPTKPCAKNIHKLNERHLSDHLVQEKITREIGICWNRMLTSIPRQVYGMQLVMEVALQVSRSIEYSIIHR